MIKVIKRNGSEVDFDKSKIEKAILKAMKYGSGAIDEEIAKQIATDCEKDFMANNKGAIRITQIEDYVYYSLIRHDQKLTAKAYEGYRAVQSFKRAVNTTDDSILSLINRQNEDVMNEKSNKNPVVIATQRDLIAGEVSKDIARRKLIPSYIVQAHDEGAIHWHDADYTISPMFNCC